MITLDKPRLHLIACVLYSPPSWIEWLSSTLCNRSTKYADDYNKYPDDSTLQDKLLDVQETLNTAVISDDSKSPQEQLLELMDSAIKSEDYKRVIEIHEEIDRIMRLRITPKIRARAKAAVAKLVSAEEGITLPPKTRKKKPVKAAKS